MLPSLLKKWDHPWRAARMEQKSNQRSVVVFHGFSIPGFQFPIIYQFPNATPSFRIRLPSFRIPLPVSEYHVPVSEYHCLVSEYHCPVSEYHFPVSEYHFHFLNPSFRIPPPVSEYHSPVSEYHRDLTLLAILKVNGANWLLALEIKLELRKKFLLLTRYHYWSDNIT